MYMPSRHFVSRPQHMMGPNPSPMSDMTRALSAGGAAAGAYHGYRRTGSVGWAIGWSLLGGLAPLITVPIAVAQGFGKRKVKR